MKNGTKMRRHRDLHTDCVIVVVVVFPSAQVHETPVVLMHNLQ